MTIPVFVVRKLGLKCPACRAVVILGDLHLCTSSEGIESKLMLFTPIILSSWTDPYAAKHEAQRWEEDSKIPHEVIPGNLDIETCVVTDRR